MARAAFEDIAETFEFLDDWEDRYRHVIEMGKAMAPLDPSEKIESTRVHGCASQVWLVPEVEGTGPEAVLRFRGESDAMIVQGLIAILRALYDGETAQRILQIDASAELARLGLQDNLSSQRSNGLKAMVARIRQLAEKASDPGAGA